MTTFSDPGFRVSGPDDDPADDDIESEFDSDMDAELDRDIDTDIDVEVGDGVDAESDGDDDSEVDETALDELDELDEDMDQDDSDDEEFDEVVADDSVEDSGEVDAEEAEANDELEIDAGDSEIEAADIEEAEDDVVADEIDVEDLAEEDLEYLEYLEHDEEAEEAVQDDVEDLVEDEDLFEEPEPAQDPEVVEEREFEAPFQVSTPLEPEPSPFWSMSQLVAVGQRALAVLVVMGVLGYGLGALRGSSHTARAEFVYTLDESVPDSFLREDRRLLTQVVTFKSDAVLTPVAAEFGLTVDQLRSKIDVETLDLSEVLRLDVTDGDEDQAIALSRAVLNRYLQVITDASPAGDSTAELAQRRADVAAELATADGARKALLEATQQDVALEVRQDSIQRQINLRDEQLNRIQGSLDDALIQGLAATRLSDLTDQYDATLLLIAALETDLIDVGSRRAALSSQTTAEPALLREIDRLETVLTTIDDELSQRELAPLVASPIRELSEPITLFRSQHIVGLQGMALGLMLGLPLAGLVAYRTRKRQLWFD